jgi:predicted nucleotidyltransferase
MEVNIPVKYRQDVENATFLLKNEGCKNVFLFGSLVTGKLNEYSDIDIGIKGLPRQKFLKLYSKLHFDFDNKIDLVDFDKNESFYSMLYDLGEVIQIG